MNNQVTFKSEEKDWILVRQASDNGDDDATLALALRRLLNQELDSLFAEHANFFFIEDPASDPVRMIHCNLIMKRVGSLARQRSALLYEDYKIQTKRLQIALNTLARKSLKPGNDQPTIG